MRKLPPEDVKLKIIALAKNGIYPKDIANQIGWHKSSVLRVLSKSGINVRKAKTEADQEKNIKKIKELAAQGLYAEKIAESMGLTSSAVLKYSKKFKINLPKGHIHKGDWKKKHFPCSICKKIHNFKESLYKKGYDTCSNECLIEKRRLRKVQKPHRKPLITFKCKGCGKDFQDISPKRSYCSQECWNGWVKEKPKAVCKTCKKEFFYKKSEKRQFCSKKCHDEGQKLINSNPEFLEKVRDSIKKARLEGKPNSEVAKELNVHDSHLSNILAKYFNHKKHSITKSYQEKKIIEYLEEALQEKNQGAGVYPNTKYTYDAKFSIGFIEYDGKGGHYRPDQIARDMEKDKLALNLPIVRVSSQAFFGGLEYLKLMLKDERSGYTAAKVKEYRVALVETNTDKLLCKEMLSNCHPLENCGGALTFSLKYDNKIIGVAKFGSPTDKNEEGLELRRFFVLDGTPKNTESYFLSKCMKILKSMGHKELVSYCHHYEKGSYMLAVGWKEVERKKIEYDYYLWNGRSFSKRVWWKWAQKAGLADQYGGEAAKAILAEYLGAKVVYEGSKKKFKVSL